MESGAFDGQERKRLDMEKTVAFQKNARNIFFHILTRCNLKCRHCYIKTEQHGRQTLPVATIRKWLKAFMSGNKASNLIFIGGEPTLHPNLDTCIKDAKEIGYDSITVDTNGFFFNRILEKTTPQQLDYFSVGLDGSCEEVNDPIRGKGSYRRCVAGMKKALSRGFQISVIYTVSQLNIRDLKNIPRFLDQLGIQRLFIQVIGIRGRSAESARAELQIARKEWTRVVPPVAARAAKLGIHVTYPKVFLDPPERFECAGLVAENYFIFPNGRVYQCPLCEDFPLHGYVLENNRMRPTPPINESDLFQLTIPEGCVMNKLIQPGNLMYDRQGRPKYKIACCLLKEQIKPGKVI